MTTWQRYLIVLLTLIVAGGAAYAYSQYSYQHSSLADTAQVRMTVSGFGDQLKQVPVLAPHDLFVKAMNMYYAIYVAPSLLEEWNARPETAPGRQTSSPWPDRIEVGDVTRNSDGTYSVLGNVVEVANGSNGQETVGSYPVRITLTKGPDGWQITKFEKQ
jgi:hypothetical protein